MKSVALIEAARKYAGDETFYVQSYRAFRSRWRENSWWSMDGPSALEARELLDFLVSWKSRIHYKKNPQRVVEHLALAARKVASAVPTLRITRLESITLDEATRGSIAAAFDTFCLLPDGRHTYTGAAKALHMMNPALFVMWDANIRSAYQLRTGNGRDYAGVFLPRMQSELRESLDETAREAGIPADRAADLLTGRCCGDWERPLAKIVDEYNFCTFTQSTRSRA